MKPILLKMQAFGPFSQETEIDFTKIGDNGLFLITGDTGSGKTTIFDAISFCLYGEPSGGTEKRNSKSYVSDYAPFGLEPYVEFTFEHKKSKYSIRRSLAYQRNKKFGEGITEESAKCIYKCLDTGKILTNSEEINNEVKQLIGLSRKQFSQTIMIAQGDFMKIINEKSDERKKLFQQLFNTQIYANIQLRLKEMDKEYNQENAHYNENMQQAIDRIIFDKEYVYANGGCCFLDSYKADSVIEYLEKMLSFTLKKQDDFEKILKKYKRDKENSIKKYQDGKHINDAFAKLEQLNKDIEKLLEQKSDIESLQRIVEKANKTKELLPLEALINNNQSLIKKTTKIVNDDTVILDKCLKNLIVVEKEFNNAKANYEKITELNVTVNNLLQASQQLGKLVSLNKDLILINKNCNDALNISLEKDEIYKQKKEQYFANQCGLIAKELIDGSPCPVCGAVHHPKVATIKGEEVSKQDLQQAEKQRDDAEKKLKELSGKRIELQTSINELDALLTKNGLDASTNPETVKKEISDLQNSIAKIKANYESANKNYNDLNKMIEVKKAAISKSNNDLAIMNTKIAQQRAEFSTKLVDLQFENENDYETSKLEDNDLKAKQLQLSQYQQTVKSIQDQIAALNKQLEKKKPVELTDLSQKQKRIDDDIRKTTDIYNQLLKDNARNDSALKDLNKYYKLANKSMEKYRLVDELYKVISGQKSAQAKLSFESYVQQYYFNEVIVAANKRLSILTDGAFVLRCKQEAKNFYQQVGLDLDVLDRQTGAWRDVSTLSGGETFMTALSLALGLSDVVQSQSGNIRLDSMFIDEGFGTLDDKALSQSLRLLNDLSDGKRLIGIISHVNELKEQIDKKILVTKGTQGSSVEIEI